MFNMSKSINKFTGYFRNVLVIFFSFRSLHIVWLLNKSLSFFKKYYRVSLKQSENLIKLQKYNDADIKIALSIYMKILLNYIQMISIIQSFNLQWPSYVESYLEIFTKMGGVSTQVISPDCLLQDYNIDVENIYIQTALILLLPFGIFLIAYIILTLSYLMRKKNRGFRFIVIIIVVSIFVQPAVIKSLFNNLKCKKIENHQYLYANMMIDCNSESHLRWVFFFFIV